DGYSASNHIKALIEHSHPALIDYCIVNTGKIPQELLARYTSEQSFQVVNDRKKIEHMGYRVVEDDTILIENFIRHDPMKLAKIVLDLLEEI
ncbi:MAG TPA: 2-phospho-L-lactate transferase CofD family protein, partial [Candidatus Omnitrophota bacterium]|nr:2-phospho-L-lactate transferase CofD family protein [Candidatus Omnitrophota bacterium]